MSLVPVLLLAAVPGVAWGVPACEGSLGPPTPLGRPVRLMCKDDGALGTAASYRCKATFKVKITDGILRSFDTIFGFSRNQAPKTIVEETRVEGQTISSLEDVSVSCDAN